MADVFVSYSRKNSNFAKRLVAALEADKQDIWIDWEDIPLSANWWGEICEGIEAADNFIFIITPDSVASPICNFEIAHAIRYNKRIIPLVRGEIDEKQAFASLLTAELSQSAKEILGNRDLMSVARYSWGALSRHNWLMFDNGNQFDAQFKKLIDNLNTDLQHVKSHTRYLQRVIEWKANKRNTSFLLTGDEIAVAETWLSGSHDKQPEPTNLHHIFVAESRKAENERIAREQQLSRRARNAIIATFGVILVASIGLALIFAQNNAQLQAEVATLEFQEMYNEVQADWVATRAPGLGVGSFPPSDLAQTPASDFFATATAQANLVHWETRTETFDGIEMVLVPAGCFWMGSLTNADEQPVHEICFEDNFWIDKYEVTNEQYGSTGCEDWSSEPNQPRNCINWFEARDFCEQREAHLPTEAEWEYAARGSNSLTYPWGNEFVGDHVVYEGNSDDSTANVGSRPEGASWVGAYDMSGNVWEWVSSSYDNYPYVANDEREDLNRTNVVRVLRGGSFDGNISNFRSADRDWIDPIQGKNDFGFRCARDYDE